MLTLTAEKDTETKIEKKKNKNSKKIVYTIRVKETEIKFKGTLYSMENIHKIDLIRWIRKFRKTVEDCAWTEADAIKVLQQLLNEEYYTKIKNKKILDSYLDELIYLKYTSNRAQEYSTQLQSIKQRSYRLIGNYVGDLEEIVQKYGYCTKMSKNDRIKLM